MTLGNTIYEETQVAEQPLDRLYMPMVTLSVMATEPKHDRQYDDCRNRPEVTETLPFICNMTTMTT